MVSPCRYWSACSPPVIPTANTATARARRVLVLTPTRELAAQVHDSFKVYARDLPLNSTCIFGGVGMNPQIQALAKGVDVLVACPGRLLDLAGQNKVDLSHVEILVLDEADRMLDMGFIHDVKKVLAKLPPKRQNLLFSATFSKDIVDLANKLLHNPERIEVTPPNTTVERIEQRVFRLPAPQKRALLAHLVTVGAWEQVLVFTRTKHGANRLAEYLTKHGLPAAAIHGNKSQNARTKALADFKANDVRILVATDIAARGLDIDQLPHVVNYELPNVEEDYVHRIGRTGRAGRSGEAISLVAPDEAAQGHREDDQTAYSRWRCPGFRPRGRAARGGPAGAREAPQKQPRRDKERRSSRERKPKDAQASNPDSNVAAAQDGTEKPAGKRRRRGGKNKENREAGQAQQPRQSREARPAKPNRPPEVDGNRDPEEFLDDDFDNFGNRADYVSPYQGQENKGRGRRGGQQKPQGGTGQQGRGQGQGQARGRARAPLKAALAVRVPARAGEETALQQAARPGSRECLADERRAAARAVRVRHRQAAEPPAGGDQQARPGAHGSLPHRRAGSTSWSRGARASAPHC